MEGVGRDNVLESGNGGAIAYYICERKILTTH